jgi:hypothetical protein
MAPKKKGNAKKEGKKKSKKEEVSNSDTAKMLKSKYLANAKHFVTDPLSDVVRKLNISAEKDSKFSQIILNSIILKSSDVSSIMETFYNQPEISTICVWHSLIRPNVLQLLVSFALCKPIDKI